MSIKIVCNRELYKMGRYIHKGLPWVARVNESPTRQFFAEKEGSLEHWQLMGVHIYP